MKKPLPHHSRHAPETPLLLRGTKQSEGILGACDKMGWLTRVRNTSLSIFGEGRVSPTQLVGGEVDSRRSENAIKTPLQG